MLVVTERGSILHEDSPRVELDIYEIMNANYKPKRSHSCQKNLWKLHRFRTFSDERKNGRKMAVSKVFAPPAWGRDVDIVPFGAPAAGGPLGIVLGGNNTSARRCYWAKP